MGPHYDDIYPPPRDAAPTEDKPASVYSSNREAVERLEARIEEVLRQNTMYREKTVVQLTSLRNEMNAINAVATEQYMYVVELRTKLKETIRGVERLATGKSLGNLGLPTEESWQKSTS